MLFKQLFDVESSTLTYLIADTASSEALLIDPVDTQIDTYKALLKEYGLALKYSLETHVHADHITASGLLRRELNCKTAVSQQCDPQNADIKITDWDKFQLGDEETIIARATPGHTKGSVSFLWRDRVFTGDSLLINGCGRTDFQGGDAGSLYDSITNLLFNLPDETLVYPGHDYKGFRVSSIGQEKLSNPRLAGKRRTDFIEIMDNLNLPKPRLIDVAVPANIYCGIEEEEATQSSDLATFPAPYTFSPAQLVAKVKPRVTEITVQEVHTLMSKSDVCLIDLREENEYADGEIYEALKIPRGVLEFKINDIEKITNPDTQIILFCRSGNRSALAADSLNSMGFKNVMSMIGGYQEWEKYKNIYKNNGENYG